MMLTVKRMQRYA